MWTWPRQKCPHHQQAGRGEGHQLRADGGLAGQDARAFEVLAQCLFCFSHAEDSRRFASEEPGNQI
eukprot:11526908-Alexandrium_andersonii.AAC.1